VDEVTCDDEASVANKTKPDNQNLAVPVFVRLTGNTPQKGANNIAFARRTAIHLTGIMISPVGVKGQPFPQSPLLTHRIVQDDEQLGSNANIADGIRKATHSDEIRPIIRPWPLPPLRHRRAG
jgi:hypothetical protein